VAARIYPNKEQTMAARSNNRTAHYWAGKRIGAPRVPSPAQQRANLDEARASIKAAREKAARKAARERA